MILGYGIIAIPTGIVSSEMTKNNNDIESNTQSCKSCASDDHKDKAEFCYKCGSQLNI